MKHQFPNDKILIITIIFIIAFISCQRDGSAYQPNNRGKDKEQISGFKEIDTSCSNRSKPVNQVVKREINAHDSSIIRRDSLLEKYKHNRTFNCLASIKNGTTFLEIETFYLNDTLAIEDEVFDLVSRPVIQKQKLIFKNGTSVIKTFYLPTRQVDRASRSSIKISGAELLIYEIFVIEGLKGSFFGIYGAKLCAVGDCGEFYNYYSVDGTLLLHDSGDRDNSIEFKKIFEKFGISDNDFNMGRNKVTNVIGFW